jgi:hypothetical protein
MLKDSKLINHFIISYLGGIILNKLFYIFLLIINVFFLYFMIFLVLNFLKRINLNKNE